MILSNRPQIKDLEKQLLTLRASADETKRTTDAELNQLRNELQVSSSTIDKLNADRAEVTKQRDDGLTRLQAMQASNPVASNNSKEFSAPTVLGDSQDPIIRDFGDIAAKILQDADREPESDFDPGTLFDLEQGARTMADQEREPSHGKGWFSFFQGTPKPRSSRVIEDSQDITGAKPTGFGVTSLTSSRVVEDSQLRAAADKTNARNASQRTQLDGSRRLSGSQHGSTADQSHSRNASQRTQSDGSQRFSGSQRFNSEMLSTPRLRVSKSTSKRKVTIETSDADMRSPSKRIKFESQATDSQLPPSMAPPVRTAQGIKKTKESKKGTLR